MSISLNKYYTYQDEHGFQISEEKCVQLINDLLKQYSRKSILKMLSDVASFIKNGDKREIIIEYQKKTFGMEYEVFLCHTRSILTLFQFVFENKFFDSAKEEVLNLHIFDLFLLANTYYEYKNESNITLDADSTFLYSFRDIHNSFSDHDSHFYYLFFKRIHKRMKSSNQLEIFNKILQERIGIDINIYSDLLSDLTDKGKGAQLFQLLHTNFSLEYSLIDSEWDNRRFKLSIPFNYFFIYKYPIVNIDGQLFITSQNALLYSVFTLLYRELNENNPNLFKSEFGINIAEPEMVELLKESFISEGSKPLTITLGSKYSYADFAFVYGNDIFLFEIKTSMLNDKNRYVEKEEFFYQNFEEKYIKNEGVNQQLKRLIDLNRNFSDFIEKNKNVLSKSVRYNVYPILFIFDESFQAFGCNNYIKKRFKELININKYILSEFNLGCYDTVVTVNEIQSLKSKFTNFSSRIELLKEYTQIMEGISFNILLIHNQANN